MPFLLIVLFLLLPSCSHATAEDTVVMALDSGPINLDPRIGTDATSERLHALLFSSLLRRTEQAEIEPDLATHWEIPDPQTYIFHLRTGVRFHDGRPLTARDVAFTFRTVIDGSLQTPKTGAYRVIDSVKAPDERTVVFKLKEPFAPFLWDVTLPGIGIIPEGSATDFRKTPIGSGPFKFVRNIQDTEVVLERNSDYFGAKASISAIQFKIIPEAIVRALELKKGSVDVALNMPPDMVEALRSQKNLRVVEGPGTNYQYIAFNLKDPLLGDLRVRKAIAHAIDREKIAKYLLRGEARLATGIIPPNNWCYEPDVATYSFDPVRARELLKDAGYSNLTFTYRTSTDDTPRLLASVFQQQLREVGIRMEIRSNEFATFYSDVQKGSFQAYSMQWIGGNNDPDIFNSVFHSDMVPPLGANRGHYANPEIDQLINFARRDSDMERRKEAYQKVQKIIAEQLPYVSLWYLNNVAVYNERIQGLKLYPAGDYEFLEKVTIAGVK